MSHLTPLPSQQAALDQVPVVAVAPIVTDPPEATEASKDSAHPGGGKFFTLRATPPAHPGT